MGPKLRYGGIENFFKLRVEHTESFAYVLDVYSVEVLKIVSKESRENDLLVESLGNLKSNINKPCI